MAKDKRYYGDRTGIMVRVPDDQKHVYEELAAKENLSLGAWAAKQLSTVAGLPIPEFVDRQAERNKLLKARKEASSAA